MLTASAVHCLTDSSTLRSTSGFFLLAFALWFALDLLSFIVLMVASFTCIELPEVAVISSRTFSNFICADELDQTTHRLQTAS